jgi:D-methionine transport system permease protein
MFETTLTAAQFLTAGYQTLIMVFTALFFGTVFGGAIGVALLISRPDGIAPRAGLYKGLNTVVNVFRSLPFIILLVAIIPLTRLLVGTSIGTAAAIVPLVIYISPFIGRLVESALLDVGDGILEAAKAMGATTFQTIYHFLLPEARASLVLGLTIATVNLISATAMAGVVGGGGIGDLAINYGYQRFDNVAMLITVVVLILCVQAIQTLGNFVAQRLRP